MSALCFGVGIDTARLGHHVTFLDSQKRTAAKAFHFKEDQPDFLVVSEKLGECRHLRR